MNKITELPVAIKNATMKINLCSDLNQPTGKGVRITLIQDKRRISIDVNYDSFMEAMSGNYGVEAVVEVLKMETPREFPLKQITPIQK
jgi:hypothetical protein